MSDWRTDVTVKDTPSGPKLSETERVEQAHKRDRWYSETAWRSDSWHAANPCPFGVKPKSVTATGDSPVTDAAERARQRSLNAWKT
jgi:hypothetical protein